DHKLVVAQASCLPRDGLAVASLWGQWASCPLITTIRSQARCPACPQPGRLCYEPAHLSSRTFRRQLLVEKNSAEFLRLAAAAEPIQRKLRRIAAGDFPVSFSHAIVNAQPFLVATIAEHDRRSSWVICPTVRAQGPLFGR